MRKYVWYALGEIFLVVIGILIALQINNWNEERKQEEEAVKVLKDFQQSIQSNLSIDFHLMPMIQLDSVHYHIFSKSLEVDLLDKSRMIRPRDLIIDPMTTFARSTGYLENQNVSTILENERIFPERFSRSLFLVRRLNAAFQTMKSEGEEMQELQQENLLYMSSNEWMYSTDDESMRKRIEFYHTDTFFRNRLKHFNELNSGISSQYDIWTKYQLLFWLEFQMVVDGKDFIDLIEPVESLGYKKAEIVPCNNEAIENPIHSFGYWIPIYNSTSEPVEIYWRNPDTGEQNIFGIIQPGALTASYTRNDFPFIQVGSNNTCQQQYATSWTDFIVIKD